MSALATSTLPSEGSSTRGQSQKGTTCLGDWLHHPCRLGGPQQGDKIRNGPHVSGLATTPPPSGGSPKNGQHQKGTTLGRIGYITPAVWGVPHKGTNIIKGPHVGGLATSPLPSRGSPQRGKIKKRPTRGRIGYITLTVREVPVKGTKSELAYMWVDWLHHPCLLESHPQGGKLGSGPHLGGFATSPPPFRGSPTRGQKQKGATRWEDWLHHPCRLGGHQQGCKSRRGPHASGLTTSPLPSRGPPTRGQRQKGTTRWGDGLHHPYRLGGPQQGDKIRKGPHVGRLGTLPLSSGGSPTRGQNQKGTACERIGYITRAV